MVVRDKIPFFNPLQGVQTMPQKALKSESQTLNPKPPKKHCCRDTLIHHEQILSGKLLLLSRLDDGFRV